MLILTSKVADAFDRVGVVGSMLRWMSDGVLSDMGVSNSALRLSALATIEGLLQDQPSAGALTRVDAGLLSEYICCRHKQMGCRACIGLAQEGKNGSGRR